MEYTNKLIEAYTIDNDADHNFAKCLLLLEDWLYNDELEELAKYFTVTEDNRVAILLTDLGIYKTFKSDRQKKEFLNMIELIIKSKYNRNDIDRNMDFKNRANLFYKVAKTEDCILSKLRRMLPEYNFEFGGKDINGISEHYYLFSGEGRKDPDITSKIGPSIATEIFIELKPVNAIENESTHLADVILRYSNSELSIDPQTLDAYEVFKEQELNPEDSYENKKIYFIKLIDKILADPKY